MKKRFFQHLLILAAALILPLSGQDAENTARLTAVNGNVFIMAASGEKKPAAVNMTLSEDDEIITESGTCSFSYSGVVNVDMDDNSKTRINPPDDETDAPSITCFLGKIFAKVQKLGNTTSFSVVTPTVIAGVRGTEFSVVCAEDGSSMIGVDSGLVEVEAGEGEKAECSPGQSAEAGYAGPLQKKEGFKREDFNREAWMKQKRENLMQNKDQIFEHLEKGLDRHIKFMTEAEKKMDEMEKNQKNLMMVMKKAQQQGNQQQIMRLKENAKQNFMVYAKVMRGMEQARVKCKTQFAVADRLGGSPEFKDFKDKNAQKFTRIKEHNEHFAKREALIRAKAPAIRMAFRDQKMEHRGAQPGMRQQEQHQNHGQQPRGGQPGGRPQQRR
ncbi:MAG: hypothetical protein A2096_09145 [Spirochaetes bacterium GWF1_41_5]|nr:MAG: hypothetical protein A2096_09145 [Spirochaetes bacterium GWF1_41_5]HBE03243.1 hypothetical protein [Spirochaetia bacterium]